MGKYSIREMGQTQWVGGERRCNLLGVVYPVLQNPAAIHTIAIHTYTAPPGVYVWAQGCRAHMYIANPLCEHSHPPTELVWRARFLWQSFCPFCGGDELLWDS